ncbi:MAG: efflux RND transporter permease subunit [Phycisphaerales bacterium]|nr:efflux RND transporter permease subunit [Phycisphaerales bacterium]
MLNRIIIWSLQNRFLVIVLTAALIGSGLVALRHLPIDAFPDTTPVMVQVNAVAPSLGPVEIEQQITAPLERVVSGLPKLTEVRSVSKFGFCQLAAVFEDGTDIYFARQMVSERLQSAELPEGVDRPELGPIATGLGEIFHYIVTSPTRSLTELTTIQDWIIKPQLASVSGVAEVNTWGGQRRQFQVLVQPAALVKHSLTLDDVRDALQHNNLSVGGGQLIQAGELHVIYGLALTTNLDQVGNIVIEAHDGVPIRIRDVAEVREGYEIRRGGVTANGKGEIVHGLGFMLMGENSHDVTQRLEAKLDEARKSLPEDVEVRVVYERTELVDRVIATVKRNLYEGAILVVAVLFVFLGHLRAGLIVALAIPLSMFFAFNNMVRFGIAASLLSLGAIDFGLVVDSTVIMVENCVRRLEQAGEARPAREVVRDAAIEVRGPTMFGELIIMVVYLPILLLEGIEGKLFRPMALTVLFALASSLVLSLTLMPVLCSLFLRRKQHAAKENALIRLLQAIFRPLIRAAVRHCVLTLSGGLVLLGGGVWLGAGLGAEFIPRLSEMAIVMNTVRLAGVSLDESLRYGTRIEQLLLERFPDEIRDVWSRTGSAEIATDPMGLELTDIFLTLEPREQWKRATSQDELVERLDEELARLPGMNVAFSQPIEMRMNEMIAGIRADVGVKIFGEDLEVLKQQARAAETILKSIPGSADVSVEQITGLPVVEVRIDQDAVARHGVPAAHVLEMIEALGGITVGQVREGDRRFDLVVKLGENVARDVAALSDLLITTASGEQLPLHRLATLRQVEGPATINREWQKRRIIAQCNVRGRDLGGFVSEAAGRLNAELRLPVGYHWTLGGQYQHLIRASKRLSVVVPLALAMILVLLYLSVRSVRDALIIFSGAPFAALGGIVALWLRDMPFTIAAGVGFVAVSGVSMLNGLVLVSTLRQRLAAGVALPEAIEETRVMRLRPILMTATVAALGFIPMALNTGIGAEVQRPLATVVIGGVISDNLLTLMMIPALYSLLGAGRVTKREAVGMESVGGTPSM